MRYKQIVLRIFVFFIFNLFVFNPFPKSIPAFHQGPGLYRLYGLYGLYAQDVDLIKLQKEEEERKKHTKKSKYVITNENLDKIVVPQKPYSFIRLGKQETEAAAATAGGQTGNKVKTEPTDNLGLSSQIDVTNADKEKSTKEYWQGQVLNLYNEMDKTEADIKSSQSEFNQLNNVLQGISVYHQRMEILKKMDELRKHISDSKQKLIDLNNKMNDLEDQARKLGIPPGWLRVERPEPNPVADPQVKQNGKTIQH